VWRQAARSNDSPPTPWLHYLALDSGPSDRTTAWGLPSELSGRCDTGETVTVTVRRWSRRVTALTTSATVSSPSPAESPTVKLTS